MSHLRCTKIKKCAKCINLRLKIYKINKFKEIYGVPLTSSPAAADTLCAHFADTQTKPDDYDLILTGDLGQVGSELLITLMKNNGYDISKNHNDCGNIIFDPETQDTHAGGSGCGCSASVFCGYIVPLLKKKRISNVLFMATGALMSPTSVQQGESIPGIAHAVSIKA